MEERESKIARRKGCSEEGARMKICGRTEERDVDAGKYV